MVSISKVALAVVNVPSIIRPGNCVFLSQKRNISTTSSASNFNTFPDLSCCFPHTTCFTEQPYSYDCRKIKHCLPCHDTGTPFPTLRCIPNGVFRYNSGEILGPSADKCGVYKNPEYFCFHHMSFFDFNLHMGQFRTPQISTMRKAYING